MRRFDARNHRTVRCRRCRRNRGTADRGRPSPDGVLFGFWAFSEPDSGVSVRDEHSRPAHDLGAGRGRCREPARAVQSRRPHQLGQRPPSRGRRLLDRRAHPVRHRQRHPHRAQPVRRPRAAAAPGRPGPVPAVPGGRRRGAGRRRRPLRARRPHRVLRGDGGGARRRRPAVPQRRVRPGARARRPLAARRGSSSAPSTGCSTPTTSSAPSRCRSTTSRRPTAPRGASGWSPSWPTGCSWTASPSRCTAASTSPSRCGSRWPAGARCSTSRCRARGGSRGRPTRRAGPVDAPVRAALDRLRSLVGRHGSAS